VNRTTQKTALFSHTNSTPAMLAVEVAATHQSDQHYCESRQRSSKLSSLKLVSVQKKPD